MASWHKCIEAIQAFHMIYRMLNILIKLKY